MKCEKCKKEIDGNVEVTKELVVKQLNSGYYEFNSEKVNGEFRKDLKTINYDLSEANLSEADLSEADLSEANLSKANLRKANLRKADLSEANLSEANLRKANLSETDLNCVFYTTIVTEKQREYIMTKTDLFTIKR